MSSYKLLIAGLVPLGVYTLHVIGRANGMFPLLESAIEARLLTDTTISWPTWLQKAPNLAGILVGFFYPLATGSHIAGSLNSLAFVGNSFAMWLVMMLEAGRGGMRGSITSFITIYGLIFQVAGIGVIGPAFLALNLYLSPNPSDPKPTNIAISDHAYLKSVPYALLTGFVMPTFAMSLPLSLNKKLIAILFWQAFPLWTNLSTYLIKPFFGTELALPPDGKKQLPLLRKAYALGLVLASVTHVSVLGISLTSLVAPALFRSGNLGDLHPASIYLPTFSTEQVSSVGDGGLKFLQWDYAIISAAQVLWAVAQTRKVDRKGLGFSLGNIWADVAARSVVFGPLATALTIVWERDEVVLGEGTGKKTA